MDKVQQVSQGAEKDPRTTWAARKRRSLRLQQIRQLREVLER